jgi:nucleoid-associated protein YgaU
MPSLEKALITNTNTGERVSVEFNPEEYTLNKDINYAQTAVPGLSSPILQFVHGNLQTLEMELFLDTLEAHTGTSAGQDVRSLVRKVTALMAIDPATHAPPILLFTWGSLSFTCVLARAGQRYTMFLPSGVPVRARLQVTFNEFRNVDLEAKEIKRETSSYTRRYVVTQGETLDSIAVKTYGDPALWRPIAILNGIIDPRRLEAGVRLVVPQLPFRDPDTGAMYP